MSAFVGSVTTLSRQAANGYSILPRIPRLQGGQEATLSADAELTATTHRQAWSRPPINIDFSVVMFTASGLLVRFLKVFEKGNYQSVKWVRYLTKAQGSYQVRVSPANLALLLASGFSLFARS